MEQGPVKRIPTSLLRKLLLDSGARCYFPGCEFDHFLENGISLLEIALIVPLYQGGTHDLDNLMLLCPNHHRLIDRRPTRYSAAWLRQIKAIQDRESRSVSEPQVANTPVPPLKHEVSSPLRAGLDAWLQNSTNAREEYWQELFEVLPACLAAALNGRAYTLRSKCYVGGKGFDNTGGSILDFLALHASSACCVEIKTPMTRLVGKRYRGNVYLPSEELLGACLQVQASKRLLVENLASLNSRASTKSITAVNPECYVIIGNLQRENLDSVQLASFEEFRRSFRDLIVRTYDEVFDGVRMLLSASGR